MLNNKVIIIGYSGHAMVVADAAFQQGLDLCYYTEKKEALKNPFDLEYAGFEQDTGFWEGKTAVEFILGIGSNQVRSQVAEGILGRGKHLLNVIHPGAGISSKATLGTGNFVNNGAVINALADLGDYCIINTGAIVEHECQLGKAVHIAPGAVLAGGVTIGARSFIGANAVIKEGVSIGTDVVIGAGSVIIRDVLDNETIVGNPGRKL